MSKALTQSRKIKSFNAKAQRRKDAKEKQKHEGQAEQKRIGKGKAIKRIELSLLINIR
jgi:hypothetical protein